MIIGVDPGTTTGVVLWAPNTRNFYFHAQLPALQAVELVWSFIDSTHDPELSRTVVCERYDITSGTARVARNRDPYHVEGALRFRCEQANVAFHQESRADAKRFAHDERLKRLGCYWAGQEHSRDASRQVITYLAGSDPGFRTYIAEVERGDG